MSPAPWAALQAETLMTKTEVDRARRGARQAAASLRAALHICQDRHATPHADQAVAALVGLTGQPPARRAFSTQLGGHDLGGRRPRRPVSTQLTE